MYFILLGLLMAILSCGVYFVISDILKRFSYRRGKNRAHRICKKCGAHQVLMKSRYGSWWEEIYPIGNDPDCKCHTDVEERNW